MEDMKIAKTIRIFRSIPALATDRLLLRRMRASDYLDMFEYARRSDVTEYLLWYPHPDEGYTHDYLKYVDTRYKAGDFYDWAITLKENGKMIGTCGFTKIDHKCSTGEIGYVLNPAYQGKGYATEAAKQIVKFGFDVLELHRIEARFIIGNRKSLRVMQRIGMQFEGYLRDSMIVKKEYKTIGVCSIINGELS